MILSEYQELQCASMELIQSKDMDAPRMADIHKMVSILALEYHLDMLQCMTELAKCVVVNSSFSESRILLQQALASGMNLTDAGKFVRRYSGVVPD